MLVLAGVALEGPGQRRLLLAVMVVLVAAVGDRAGSHVVVSPG